MTSTDGGPLEPICADCEPQSDGFTICDPSLPACPVPSELQLSADAVRTSPDGSTRTVASYTVELGGERFTQEQWEAVEVYVQGTSSAAAPANDPGLDHLLEEVAVEVLRQDAAGAEWPVVEWSRASMIFTAARTLRSVRAIDQAAGGEQP